MEISTSHDNGSPILPGYEANLPADAAQIRHVRDPIHKIRLERDPTVGPAEMRRPSALLAFGPDQFSFFDEVTESRFVVKRHRATTLHTDFRLEVGKYLLSWVLKERPSNCSPAELWAREMADHDPKYIHSERRIPDGMYGAGPMVVWDLGTYQPILEEGRSVIKALQEGRLDFSLRGKRLHGRFRLRKAGRDWRFSRIDDGTVATFEEVEDRSVLSGRTLDHIEAEYQAQQRRLRGV